MNRGYLAFGAAAVLAAILGLYAVMSKGGGPATPSPADPRNMTEARPDTPGIVVSRPPARPGARPAVPSGSAASSDYTVGNVRIRDHRSGEHPQVDVPPAIHPPEGRKIPSQLTSDIAQRLRALTSACGASVPPEARGAAPRLDGEIQIAIKNQQATVTSAIFQARDVAAASQDAVKQCMEQKAIGVGAPSGDEPDVEGYAITLSLRLP
jgi:hypothetical protein